MAIIFFSLGINASFHDNLQIVQRTPAFYFSKGEMILLSPSGTVVNVTYYNHGALVEHERQPLKSDWTTPDSLKKSIFPCRM
jgi:hypothetical protein